MTLPAGKHTLTIKNTQSSIVKLNWLAFGLTSGINKPTTADLNSGVRYNLAGQKVNDNYRGIVIVNGKKMVKK